MLPTPNLPERYAFVRDLCGGVLLTTRELADRWRMSVNALNNARSLGTSAIPYLNLTGGAVRYRLSDVLAHEMSCTRGPFTIDDVSAELATMPDVAPELAAKIVARLRTARGLRSP